MVLRVTAAFWWLLHHKEYLLVLLKYMASTDQEPFNGTSNNSFWMIHSAVPVTADVAGPPDRPPG